MAVALNGQGGRNFAGPLQKNAGSRGLSALDVVIQGGYLALGAGPVEFADWLMGPSLAIAADLNATVVAAIAAQSEPLISAAQNYSLSAGAFASTALAAVTDAQSAQVGAVNAQVAAAASLATMLANKGTAADVRLGTDDTKYPTAKAFTDSAAFVATITGEISGSTVTLDFSTGYNKVHTITTTNTTIGFDVTKMKDGQPYAIKVVGDGTHTIAFDLTKIDFGTDGTPSPNTGAGKINKVYGQWDATAGKLQATFWKQA